jgi:hypothetical protein
MAPALPDQVAPWRTTAGSSRSADAPRLLPGCSGRSVAGSAYPAPARCILCPVNRSQSNSARRMHRPASKSYGSPILRRSARAYGRCLSKKVLDHCVMTFPSNPATRPCVLLVEDSLNEASILKGFLWNLGFDALGPYPSMQNALCMLKWAGADVVIFNASSLDLATAETLATSLDDLEIPSIMVNWSPVPTMSLLRYGRKELFWPLSEGELARALRGLLDRDQGAVWQPTSTR